MQIVCLSKDAALLENLCTLFGKKNISAATDSREINVEELSKCEILLVDLAHSKIPGVKGAPYKLIALTTVPKFEEALVLLQSGVRGYGNRKMLTENLAQLVNTVSSGQLWMPPEILVQLIGQLEPAPESTPKSKLFDRLSKREKEVADYVVKGLSNQIIAEKMYVSLRTVKAHLSSIYEKTGIKNRLELAVKLKEL